MNNLLQYTLALTHIVALAAEYIGRRKVPSAVYSELPKVSNATPAVGQNIALGTSPTARNFLLSNFCLPYLHTPFPLPPGPNTERLV